MGAVHKTYRLDYIHVTYKHIYEYKSLGNSNSVLSCKDIIGTRRYDKLIC